MVQVLQPNITLRQPVLKSAGQELIKTVLKKIIIFNNCKCSFPVSLPVRGSAGRRSVVLLKLLGFVFLFEIVI